MYIVVNEKYVEYLTLGSSIIFQARTTPAAIPAANTRGGTAVGRAILPVFVPGDAVCAGSALEAEPVDAVALPVGASVASVRCWG